MAKRIAIASSDGIVVNAHFGGADQFHIAELTDAGYVYLETRSVTPACNHFEHTASGFDAVLAALSDCHIVAVSRIGQSALEYVREKGLSVVVYQGTVEDFLTEESRKEILGDGE